MNNNDDKYYVPDISDIYDGYELEYCEDVFKENKWQTHIHREGDTYNILSLGRIYTIRELLETSLIRVPFLTKEQIEGEGWIYEQEEFEGWGLVFSKEVNYPIPHWELRFLPEVHKICLQSFIAEADTLVRHYEIKYNGYCPSINELRYICKLLKI